MLLGLLISPLCSNELALVNEFLFIHYIHLIKNLFIIDLKDYFSSIFASLSYKFFSLFFKSLRVKFL
jgi:hypothetical protein